MSDVKLVLIDDCLAAVDVHVARAICEEAVLGTLLDGQRTAPRTRGAQSQESDFRKCPKESASKDIHSMGKEALFVRTPCVPQFRATDRPASASLPSRYFSGGNGDELQLCGHSGALAACNKPLPKGYLTGLGNLCWVGHYMET